MSTDALQPNRIPPRRRSAGRRVTPERLTAILDAAEELCLSGGYSAITMQAISARTGYVRPVIYDCYGSADNIVVQMVARTVDILRGEIDLLTTAVSQAAGDGTNPTAAALLAVTDSVYAHPRAWRLSAASAINAPEEARRAIADVRGALRDISQTALRESLGTRPQPSPDSEVIVYLLQGIVDEFISRICSNPESYPPARTRAFVESAIASTRFKS